MIRILFLNLLSVYAFVDRILALVIIYSMFSAQSRLSLLDTAFRLCTYLLDIVIFISNVATWILKQLFS